jgi:cytochrome c oxidase assembly protein subunit 15
MNSTSAASVNSPVSFFAAASANNARAVALWLFACCLLVFAMVVVGGITRLTHSGLSITEWQPIVGTLPPLTDAQWEEAFAKYRATPEFRLVNHDMTLAAFRGIFWWEYFHRLLGRAIGVVFLLPLLWFALRRAIPRGQVPKLAVIFLLGGLQGAMGWYMVQSGLVDDPRVSPFRLTAHLGIALLIFAAMFWMAMNLVAPRALRAEPDETAPGARESRATSRQHTVRKLSFAVVALVFLMALAGGFVAGIRAGLAYNTFPLMNGQVVPPELFMLEPWWMNFFYNMATVQFDHRLIAWVLAIAVPILWWLVRTTRGLPPRAHAGSYWLLALLAVQIALGIATLVQAVPLPLAAAHQAGAVLVFAAALNLAHALR